MAEFAPEAWLLDKKIATLAPNAAGLPSLVQAITGERVTGSWWGHPQGNAIYNASQVLGDSDIALTMKLVDAKVTFVHCSLWGAILGAVLDPHWQQSARLRLKPLAAAVLTRVEREGTLLYVPSNVPFDADRKTMRAARVELERSAVLIVGEKHTDTGAHAPFLESWKHFRKTRAAAIDDVPTREEALRILGARTGAGRLTIDARQRSSH